MKKILLYAVFLSGGFCANAQTLVQTGSLQNIRWNHQAQTLNNGNVLCMGGDDAVTPGGGPVYVECELYTPGSGTWAAAGSMNDRRSKFATALLPNGNVIAIGGKRTAAVSQSASCEIYDVATNTWSYTDSMSIPRYEHEAVTLQNGKILVVGGNWGFEAELYDPATGLWSLAGNTNYQHMDGVSMIRLGDGKVLCTGGDGLPNNKTAEIYDPNTDIWTIIPDLLEGRDNHESVLLNNGTVLIYGGDALFQSTCEIYDPVGNTFTVTGSTDSDRAWSPAMKLTDGRVFLVGMGDFLSPGDTKEIEIYDPATGLWTSPLTSGMGTGVYAITALQNGQILVIAGNISTGSGAFDLCWLVNGVTAAGVNELPESIGMNLYPNPAQEVLNVDIEANALQGNFTLQIVDMAGKIVKSDIELNSGSNSISLEGINSGLYNCSILLDGQAIGSKQLKID